MLSVVVPSISIARSLFSILMSRPVPWRLLHQIYDSGEPVDTRENEECEEGEDLQPVIDGAQTGMEEVLDVNATNEPI